MNKYSLSILALLPTLAFAAGPLTLEGANGNTPIRYESPKVTLNFDIGTLGTKTNAEADTLVLTGFELWNNVTTATINLTQGNDLDVDVDSSNYTSYIPSDFSDTTFADGDDLNPVIYDNDGSIIDAFFGVGNSDLIAGFATSAYFVGSEYFDEGYAVINGKDLGLDDIQLTLLVAHEVGHFIGLDHTLTHITETASNVCDTKARDVYPLMYPYVCRYDDTTPSLHQDDIISASTLYPATDINQNFGQINGHFTQTNDTAILGANIYVRNTSTNKVYSVISDYLKQGTGFFSLYLPPGNYSLHANSLNILFSGGSSVGPYSFSSGDESFQSPNPITAINFEGTTGSTVFLTVTTGEATEVEFKLDGSGAFTTGNVPFAPTYTAVTTSSGGGSGSTSPVMLALLLIAGLLRLPVHRH